MYKIAAQNKFRFLSNRGALSVEQLFDLQLKNSSGFDLDSVAREINNELKERTEESFVEIATDTGTKILETMLDIVKDVIKTKQEAITAHFNKAKKATERKKILDVIAAKKDEKLSQASLEELEKQLAALED